MTDPAVVVDDVSKHFRLYHDRNQSLKAIVMRGGRARFEEFWALRDVSLEVPQGSTFGFIGTNGSGKSTLLKCIARILTPDAGSITTRGKVSALLELGAGFHPELSGRENVYLNGSILGLSKAELDRRFDDIVEFAGLERFIDSPVKNYSSGMYVRLGFSVAINVDPDVLLVDEVLAVGDEQFQRRCNERFADLKAQGRTIVVVSHSLGTVRSMCDSVAWLDNGILRSVGSAAGVIDEYLAEVNQNRGEEPHSTEGRWGGRELQIDEVSLIGADGSPTRSIQTGDQATIRIRYSTDQVITEPSFGLEIHTVEGMTVTAPNTREAGLVPPTLTGSGHVDLVIPRVMLLPGTYDISATATDKSALHVFDHHQRTFRFDVNAGTPHETAGGVVSLGGRWEQHAGQATATG